MDWNQVRWSTLGTGLGRDSSDTGAQRLERTYHRPDRWAAQDWTRRRYCCPIGGGGNGVRDSSINCHGLYHDAKVRTTATTDPSSHTDQPLDAISIPAPSASPHKTPHCEPSSKAHLSMSLTSFTTSPTNSVPSWRSLASAPSMRWSVM